MAFHDLRKLKVVRISLEPRLESARIFLHNSNSDQKSLEVKFWPTDDLQLEHTSLETNSSVEFCERPNSCYENVDLSNTVCSADVREETCRTRELPDFVHVNEYCANDWVVCPNWNSSSGTCKIDDVSISQYPCWFRVNVTNSVYKTTLLRTSPHKQILLPDPVSRVACEYTGQYSYEQYSTESTNVRVLYPSLQVVIQSNII